MEGKSAIVREDWGDCKENWEKQRSELLDDEGKKKT